MQGMGSWGGGGIGNGMLSLMVGRTMIMMMMTLALVMFMVTPGSFWARFGTASSHALREFIVKGKDIWQVFRNSIKII